MSTGDKLALSPTIKLTLERAVEDLVSDIALSIFEAKRDEWEFGSAAKRRRITDVEVTGDMKICPAGKGEPIHEINSAATGKFPYPRLAPKDYTRVGVIGKEALRITQMAIDSLAQRNGASVKFAIAVVEKAESPESSSFLASASYDKDGKLALRFNRTSPRVQFGKAGANANVNPPAA